jgi:signal transduction histidine kinase
MRSLRARLIAWHLSIGAFIVVCVALLAATALVEVGSYTARQAMASAARDAPALVAGYQATHHTVLGLEEYLQERFGNRGLLVRVRPFPPERPGIVMIAGPPPAHNFGFITTQRFMGGPAPPRPKGPSLVSMLAMEIKPVTAGFPGGEVVFFVDPRSMQGLFANLGAFVLVLAIVVLLAAWRLAVVVAERTLHPLLRTTAALNRFGSGDFTPEAVSTQDRSELGELARAYNRAVEQITRAFGERDKAAGEMRQFVADAGHQLRTPLTVIMAYVSGMANRPQSLRDAATFNTLLHQSRRMKSLIDDLITLARLEHPDAPPLANVDLNAICADLPSQFDPAVQARIRVHLAGEPAIVDANETDLLFAVSTLVDNALKYAPGSDVEISVQKEAFEWTVSVADRGPGMTEQDLRNAFDRFYRGSASEGIEGTGLGLPIVRKSIERANGSVSLEQRAGGGLLCIISLPKATLSTARYTSTANQIEGNRNEERRAYVYD